MAEKTKSDKKRRGRKKATEISVTSRKQITSLVARFKIKTPVLTYRDLQEAMTRKLGYDFSLGVIYNLARGIEPKDKELRRALRLSTSCPTCHRRISQPRVKVAVPHVGQAGWLGAWLKPIKMPTTRRVYVVWPPPPPSLSFGGGQK